MRTFFNRIRSRAGRAKARMDAYQQAISFAEGGDLAGAQEIVGQEIGEVRKETRRRLLVVGEEGSFTKEIIDYALDMAKSLSYEIVALSTAPLSCATFQRLPTPYSEVCREFESLSKKNAEVFARQASALQIPFSQVIKFKEEEEAIAEVRRELGEIEFVIAEGARERVRDQAENRPSVRPEIQVYALV